MRRALAVILTSSALTLGCGPSVPTLLAGNHFREAACATEEGHGTGDEVAGAITRALDPQLHVEVVPDDAVAAAAPATSPEVRARMLFVRVRVATNEIPIDHLGLSLDTVGEVPAHVVDLDSLARLTGERPPPSHTATETHHLQNFVSGAVTIFTLGLVDPGQRGPSTVVVPPDEFEWKHAAPSAYGLFTAFSGAGCAERRGGPEEAPHVGMGCDATFMVERAGAGSLGLDLGVVYSALRLSHNKEYRSMSEEPSWTCRVKARIHVPLGAVAELPRTSAATFGPRFRSVSELSTPESRREVLR